MRMILLREKLLVTFLMFFGNRELSRFRMAVVVFLFIVILFVGGVSKI